MMKKEILCYFDIIFGHCGDQLLGKNKSFPPAVQKYYFFLDGFRAIAILMILIHHARSGFNLDKLIYHNSHTLSWIYFKALDHGVDLTSVYLWMQDRIYKVKGVLGVEMFFVISGFLITGILLRNCGQFISPIKFYVQRFFKIVPSYWLLVIVSLSACLWFNPQDPNVKASSYVHYLFFIQNYFPRNSFLDHTWTMGIIEQFYLFCPLVIIFVYSRIASSRNRELTLMGICIFLMIITPLIRIYCVNTDQTILSWPLQAPNPHRTSLYHLDSIAFGSLMALWEPYLGSWRKNKKLGWGLWATGISTYCYLYFVLDWSYFWGEWYLYTLGYLASGLLILAAYHGASTLSSLKSLQWIGRHSYGIYLWHYLILICWQKAIGKVPLIVIIPSYVLTSVVVGVLSTKTIEHYFLSLREKLFPKVSPLLRTVPS